jgi:hypothetical protein
MNPLNTWDHSQFSVTVNNVRYHPYLAVEGQWRVQETVTTEFGSRPSFPVLHDLIVFLGGVA